MGFTNPNFKKSKARMQFYQNPRLGDKLLTIQSLKFSFHTFLTLLELLSFFLSSLLLLFLFLVFSLFLSPLSLYGLVPFKMRPNLVLNPCFDKAMFGQVILNFFSHFCILVPISLIFHPNLLNFYFWHPIFSQFP